MYIVYRLLSKCIDDSCLMTLDSILQTTELRHRVKGPRGLTAVFRVCVGVRRDADRRPTVHCEAQHAAACLSSAVWPGWQLGMMAVIEGKASTGSFLYPVLSDFLKG